LDGAEQLLDVLQAQERCLFRDLITGDETWVYVDVKPGTIWLPANAEPSVRVKRTIASEKCILIIFWGIHWVHTLLLAPKREHSRFAILLRRSAQSARSENAAKFQKAHKLLTLIHMDNAKAHAVRATQDKLDVSRFKRMPQPLYSPDIAPSDFFLFGWLKTRLNGENMMGNMNYMK
jgi:hypothetical protein